MSKQYRWCEAAGRVPFPNEPTRFLDSYDELVSGDGWAEIAELGFVEEVAAKPKKAAAKPKSKPAPKPVPVPPPLPEPVAEVPVAPAAPVVEVPAAKEDSSNKTVGQMVREAAAKSKSEPASVTGQARKVLSKRKTRAKSKAKK